MISKGWCPSISKRLQQVCTKARRHFIDNGLAYVHNIVKDFFSTLISRKAYSSNSSNSSWDLRCSAVVQRRRLYTNEKFCKKRFGTFSSQRCPSSNNIFDRFIGEDKDWIGHPLVDFFLDSPQVHKCSSKCPCLLQNCFRMANSAKWHES